VSQPNDPSPMKENPDRVDYRESADITEVHASVQREKPEPSAEVTPMPLWLTAICAGAMVWAGTYFGVFHGGLSANVYNEFESSPAVLFPQPAKAGAKSGAAEAPQSLAQLGKAVYGQCVACHQPNGLGVAGQFPHLAKSEYVNGGEKRLIAILLKGAQGPMTVDGKPFNGAMPTWEVQLSPKKIAAVASYIRKEWGNTGGEISEAKVLAAKKEFATQTAPWTEAELLKIPADANFPDEGGGAAPTAGAAPAAAPTAGTPDLMAEGKKNYMAICIACHQPTGLGLPGVFPTLAKTEYVTGDPKRFAAMILKGVAGPITVDGKIYNNAMPAQEAMLSDTKIASILTYVRANFGNTSAAVAPEVVAEARKEHAARTAPWTEAELKAFGGAAPAAQP